MHDVVVRDLERFSRREPLTITWRRNDRPDDPPIPHTGERGSGTRRSRLVAVGLAVAVAVVIGLHVGLAGSIVASSRWTGMATNIVVALVVLKIILIVLARRRIGRGRARRAPGTKPAGAGS